MNAQLEILLQIQDLKAQRGELLEGEEVTQVQKEEFGLDIDEAVAQLDTKIAGLEDEMEPATRRRYTRLADNLSRVVVPAINGICYGCFVAVPTAVASDPGDQQLTNCAHCGRFLYFMK